MIEHSIAGVVAICTIQNAQQIFHFFVQENPVECSCRCPVRLHRCGGMKLIVGDLNIVAQVAPYEKIANQGVSQKPRHKIAKSNAQGALGNLNWILAN